jgi:hypothetical protein
MNVKIDVQNVNIHKLLNLIIKLIQHRHNLQLLADPFGEVYTFAVRGWELLLG